MLEIERNSPIEAGALSEFFARCGWEESEAATKLEWALAASDEWVVCRLDGQLIGFGRVCRLDPVKRVLFDVLVDPRFKETGLGREIVRLLTENAGSLEDLAVFKAPLASPGTYLGRSRDSCAGAAPRDRRLLKNDASPPARVGYAREKDAGSANSSAICATEDVLSRRPVRSGGRVSPGGEGFVFQQPDRA